MVKSVLVACCVLAMKHALCFPDPLLQVGLVGSQVNKAAAAQPCPQLTNLVLLRDPMTRTESQISHLSGKYDK